MTAILSNRARDWRTAFTALRRLLADANDTAQVFRIMRALNVGSVKAGYARLLQSAEGGRIAYERIELADLLSDRAFVAGFREGSVGAAYRNFLAATGYSAKGLAAVSDVESTAIAARHPFAWYGRRTRDSHDIWHILTGYQADDPLGEACLVAFSYAQTGGLGWALIAAGSAFKALRSRATRPAARAIWEGYRLGRAARWLPGEDYVQLLAEPLADARRRLGIGVPHAYARIKNAGVVPLRPAA